MQNTHNPFAKKGGNRAASVPIAPRWPVCAIAAAAVSVPLLIGLFFVWQNEMMGGGGANKNRLLSPGMPAPDFTLPVADASRSVFLGGGSTASRRASGRTFHLADYKGRAVFLAFVPSWTDKKTVDELRSLVKAMPQFDAAGAKVMVISTHAPPAAMQTAQGKLGKLPFPLLIDAASVLAKRCGVPQNSQRTTFVVDPAGKVKFRVGDAAVEAARHGQQLLDISHCCVDEVMAARAHGVGRPVGNLGLLRADTGSMETLMGNGKATVVLFLSVKCPCSNAYNERIAALPKSMGAKVRIVGVYSNHDETAGEIAAHARRHGFTFAVFKDEQNLCADHLGASVTPEAFVLDDKQILRYAGRIDNSRSPAEVKTHDLTAAVSTVLLGKYPPQNDTHAFGCGIVRAGDETATKPL